MTSPRHQLLYSMPSFAGMKTTIASLVFLLFPVAAFAQDPPADPDGETSGSAPTRAEGGADSQHVEDAPDIFRIGPVVGVGLPNLLSYGGMVKVTRYIGAGINAGLVPTLQISYYDQGTISYNDIDAYGRIFPFGNALFVGAGVGYVTVSGTMSDSIPASQLGLLGGFSGVPSDSAARLPFARWS